MGYAEKVAALREKLDLDKKAEAREALHAQELEDKVAPVIIDNELTLDHVVHLEEADALPAHIVLRKPSAAEFQAFRHKMWLESKERAVTEKKSKAGGELAMQCLLYPSRKEYEDLVKASPAVADAAAKKAIKLAEAGAADLEKD